MTKRERIMATLRGEPVDRPAVSFYEIGGFAVDPTDPDPFNVYNAPSWQPLLDLAEQHTDIMRMSGPMTSPLPDAPTSEFFSYTEYMENGSKFMRTTLQVAGREFTTLRRRDPEVSTNWTLQHMLKDTDDLKAFLEVPNEVFIQVPDVSNLVALDEQLGDGGVVECEIGDPLCSAADLFSMEDYTVIALTEPELFHALLQKFARHTQPLVEQMAKDFPGHLWRVVGPEYAAEPYLPPRLFKEYVVNYTGPIVQAIAKYGGYPRIHCHGRLKNILPFFIEMGAAGIDPIEPPPQGDVELIDVRREYGRDLALFGNIEVADIENMPPPMFEKVVEKALREGTSGEGKGFVLMPSSAPYGREITDTTMRNYETMVRLAENWKG